MNKKRDNWLARHRNVSFISITLEFLSETPVGNTMLDVKKQQKTVHQERYEMNDRQAAKTAAAYAVDTCH